MGHGVNPIFVGRIPLGDFSESASHPTRALAIIFNSRVQEFGRDDWSRDINTCTRKGIADGVKSAIRDTLQWKTLGEVRMSLKASLAFEWNRRVNFGKCIVGSGETGGITPRLHGKRESLVSAILEFSERFLEYHICH